MRIRLLHQLSQSIARGRPQVRRQEVEAKRHGVRRLRLGGQAALIGKEPALQRVAYAMREITIVRLVILNTEHRGDAREQVRGVRQIGRADEGLVAACAEAHPITVASGETVAIPLVALQKLHEASHRRVHALQHAHVAGPLVQNPGYDHTRIAPRRIAPAHEARGLRSDIWIRS